MHSFTAESADGTRLHAWRNDGSGLPVALSNGLGAPPQAWPGITDTDSGFDVVGWDHRGLGGSQRPADLSRIRVEDHADDLLAVMDAAGQSRSVIIGWSLGVNVAFEVALHHPDRVAGVLAVAGIPGGTFGALFAPVGLPRRLRPHAGVLGARLLAYVGPVVRLVASGLPPHDNVEYLHAFGALERRMRHAGAGARTVRAFAQHDWQWYSQLVRAGGHHDPMDLEGLLCPTTFVAGSLDMLASSADIRLASQRIPGARYLELPGSHYLPLEFPEVVRLELAALGDRASWSG
jgi:3-oxoadipate enol-lactonase